MKFGRLVEYNTRNIFFKINAENEAGRLDSDLILFFKKFYMRQKQVVCNLVSISSDSSKLIIP